MKGRILCLATIASVSLAALNATANGRFPRAQRLLEEPGHPEHLTIAATYGLLVTDDRGKHWSYVCDAAFTFQPMFGSDVVIGLNAEGAMLLGVQKSITLSRDRGCDFTKVLEPSGSSAVDDFAMSSTNANDVLALVTTFEAGKNSIRLQESTDGGQTWKVIGQPIPAALTYTLDIDPQNSNHLYVTGSTLSSDENAPELFLTSNDRGATWTTQTIPGTSINSSPWIAAVHPKDGNKIFVRTDSWKRDGVSNESAGDALLYSEDAGKTWTELLRAGGSDPATPGAKMLGFALSPDGSTALVGYGDIVDPVRVVDPDGKWMGLYKSSSDGKYSFGAGAPAAPMRLTNVPVTCLSWTKEGIYSCFAPQGQSHYLAFTSDTSLAPASLTTLMKANEVLGAPQCCNGRAVSTCVWKNDCNALGACDAGAPPSEAGGGNCGVDGGGGAGGARPDASATGGTGGTGGGFTGGAGGATGGTSGTGGFPDDHDDPGDCTCHLGAAGGTAGRALLWMLGVLIAASRRVKRRA